RCGVLRWVVGRRAQFFLREQALRSHSGSAADRQRVVRAKESKAIAARGTGRLQSQATCTPKATCAASRADVNWPPALVLVASGALRYASRALGARNAPSVPRPCVAWVERVENGRVDLTQDIADEHRRNLPLEDARIHGVAVVAVADLRE